MNHRKGYYGEYGGQFVPETLIPALDKLESAFEEFKINEKETAKLKLLFNTYAGRPTPVYYAENISRKYGFSLYLKREDLLHTGAHKINNTLGQALLAKYMGKKRIIAETGAGQHGVASATAAALLNLECKVYMGKLDAQRQHTNVERMKLLGAEVHVVDEGSGTLKDAVSAALRDWVASSTETHYLLGSVTGPHPFPQIVSHFQSVIGSESHDYFSELGFMPDYVVACVGGGSNAMGIFQGFFNAKETHLIGVEAGGYSLLPGKNAATLTAGRKGIFQGCLSYLLQDSSCQVEDVHSVSAGLDYQSIGPQHSFLNDNEKVEYTYAFDESVVNAFHELTRLEGIIPALESSHALGFVLDNKERFSGSNILINLSGRGDKDMTIINDYRRDTI